LLLDPGEDLNGNGKLDSGEDVGNGILDPEEERQGYAIETGNPFEPIVLTYSNFYLRGAGQAELAVIVGDDPVNDRILSITGAFEIKATTTSLTIFVDVEAEIGRPDVFVLNAHALGLLVLGEYTDKTTGETVGGIAIKLDLETSFNIPGPNPDTPILASEIN
jgi:hypothetical protein